MNYEHFFTTVLARFQFWFGSTRGKIVYRKERTAHFRPLGIEDLTRLRSEPGPVKDTPQ
jgi:hypothetical protein